MTSERDKKCLVGTNGPSFLLKPTELWEMGPNNLKASDDVDVLKEIKRSVARLNHMQVKEKHHTLKNLSDSSTSTESENRLIELHKCFTALRKNPKTPSEIASCKNQVNIREQARMTLSYLKNCLGCKLKLQVREKQLMAPLSASRLKPRTHVVTCAASDLAAPFSVVVGRSTVKRWLCVFVCMVTTAVRIEVAVDLSTSSFVNAFRKFLTLYRVSNKIHMNKQWNEIERDFQVGDLVILCNEPIPKFLKYPYAIIKKIRRD